MQLTPAGSIHAVLASIGIVVGMVQFVRPKGGSIHRARGYLYFFAMVIADCSALLIFRFTGKLNILHLGAVINLTCLGLGIWPMLQRQRPRDWRAKHYMWMSCSYLGLIAAGATELVVRTIVFSEKWQVWAATAATTTGATVIGAALIRKYWPAPHAAN